MRRSTRIAAAGLLAALTLAACGGDEGEGAAPAASGAAASPTADAALDPGAPRMLLEGQRSTVLDQPLSFPRKGRVPSVTSRLVVLEPGQQTERQEYRGPTYVQVLEGSYTVEYAGGVTGTYPAGTAYLEAIDTTLVGRNDGGDPARILIVQVGAVRP